MNPSSAGWINKLLKEISENDPYLKHEKASFYDALRSCGFIYGSNLGIVAQIIQKKDLTESELCKTNLCLALYYTHANSNCDISFIESVIRFYTEIDQIKTSFFQDLLGGKNRVNN